ncbi:LamG domain-containing protein [Luteolibacter ambystomatis]|uniref:LamG domain-containing protein n=1 Tax=Luteolibacter ambystomatis TaxID=2824561 RepID=A0A975G675_9BACT|nr:LamG domain-containing protein [Luteolibacter ambystomatis]QUE49521.1 LamG domain-containing protein [Luteolibacter ambystomatis]
MGRYQPSTRLNLLLSRLTDGLLHPDEARELEEILQKDAGARTYYRFFASVHLELEDHERLAAPMVIQPRPIWQRPAWLAVAATAMLAAGLAWWQITKPRPPGPAIPGVSVHPTMAVISASKNVAWNQPMVAETGTPLQAGTIRLDAGELSLSLDGGSEVAVRAPVEFELLEKSEFALRRGQAAFRMNGQLIVHLPHAAVVNNNGEFSANVAEDGTADVRSFQESVTVSTTEDRRRSREEFLLGSGQSLHVTDKLAVTALAADQFLRLPAPAPIGYSLAGESYAKAVRESSPLHYWRFQTMDEKRQIADETGGTPLLLKKNPRIEGSAGRGYLYLDAAGSAGFATTEAPLKGLDTSTGRSIECLLFPGSDQYLTAVSLETADPAFPLPAPGAKMHHAPQLFALERMKRNGENIGHVHPDYALRSMFRSPPGYKGGTNTYSRESHLFYRWIHVVATADAGRIQLYVNGRLSDQSPAGIGFNNLNIRPIIGNLQPDPRDEQRQWIGGIDEVALYGKILTPEEVEHHFEALKQP